MRIDNISKYYLIIELRKDYLKVSFMGSSFEDISSFEYNLHSDISIERHISYIRDSLKFNVPQLNQSSCIGAFVITYRKITKELERLLSAISLGVDYTLIDAHKVIVEKISSTLREKAPSLVLILAKDKLLSSYVDRPISCDEVILTDFGSNYVINDASIKDILGGCSDMASTLSVIASFTDNIASAVIFKSAYIVSDENLNSKSICEQLHSVSRNKSISYNVLDRQANHNIIAKKLKSLYLRD